MRFEVEIWATTRDDPLCAGEPPTLREMVGDPPSWTFTGRQTNPLTGEMTDVVFDFSHLRHCPLDTYVVVKIRPVAENDDEFAALAERARQMFAASPKPKLVDLPPGYRLHAPPTAQST